MHCTIPLSLQLLADLLQPSDWSLAQPIGAYLGEAMLPTLDRSRTRPTKAKHNHPVNQLLMQLKRTAVKSKLWSKHYLAVLVTGVVRNVLSLKEQTSSVQSLASGKENWIVSYLWIYGCLYINVKYKIIQKEIYLFSVLQCSSQDFAISMWVYPLRMYSTFFWYSTYIILEKI